MACRASRSDIADSEDERSPPRSLSGLWTLWSKANLVDSDFGLYQCRGRSTEHCSALLAGQGLAGSRAFSRLRSIKEKFEVHKLGLEEYGFFVSQWELCGEASGKRWNCGGRSTYLGVKAPLHRVANCGGWQVNLRLVLRVLSIAREIRKTLAGRTRMKRICTSTVALLSPRGHIATLARAE